MLKHQVYLTPQGGTSEVPSPHFKGRRLRIRTPSLVLGTARLQVKASSEHVFDPSLHLQESCTDLKHATVKENYATVHQKHASFQLRTNHLMVKGGRLRLKDASPHSWDNSFRCFARNDGFK